MENKIRIRKSKFKSYYFIHDSVCYWVFEPLDKRCDYDYIIKEYVDDVGRTVGFIEGRKVFLKGKFIGVV